MSRSPAGRYHSYTNERYYHEGRRTREDRNAGDREKELMDKYDGR